MSEYIATVVEGSLIQCDFTQEIVRCRDCKHFMNGDLCKLQDEWNEFHWLQVEPDGFCKWASRKDSGRS